MPGIPHSFGCKATDWLRGISSSFKKITLGVSVVILDGASIVQMLNGVGVSTVQYKISTFCGVYQMDLVCYTCRADSLKASTKETQESNIHRRFGQSINCHAEKLARFLVSR